MAQLEEDELRAALWQLHLRFGFREVPELSSRLHIASKPFPAPRGDTRTWQLFVQ